MGCDGGTIPKRDELVKTKKKPEKKDKDAELSFRWRHCSLSQQPLQKPIVACGLGKLYNKVAVLEALLDRNNIPDVAKHIKSLKDVKDLTLISNPAFQEEAEKGDGYIDRQAAPFICPVIGIEMSGRFKFCLLWSCGCVMSERALKTIKTKTCHKCQQPFQESDIVILNATDDDLDLMQTRLDARTARIKAEKKAKKSAVKKEPEEVMESIPSTSSGNVSNDVKVVPKEKKIVKSEKRPVQNDNEIPNPAFKKTKGDYSVAKDPSTSEVFKSLFTSHKNAKEQTRAHWVTYNPFYN
uniref:Replication termination factor 2 n=1 Tax=Clastoptera arizonana TaxID=38151 RepID=A0A1B6CZ21_9HEMI